jgi:hypothetical protein
MAKRKTRPSKNSLRRQGRGQQNLQTGKKTSNRPPTKPSKQATVIGMLSQPDGTTIAAIMEATGWRQNSVRGFFAGIVRKKLKLTLESKRTDRERIYYIAGKQTNSNTPKAVSE